MSAKRERKKPLTLPDLVVLSVLSEKPMHGYQLVRELEIREVKDWAAISRPQVYYSLNKLLESKMILVAKDPEESFGPEKTTFRIGATGKEALAASLSTHNWARQRERPPFLTWMALSTHLPKNTIRRLFEERRKYLQAEVQKEKATLDSFKNATGPMVTAGFLMVSLTVQMFDLELHWLEEARNQMIGHGNS